MQEGHVLDKQANLFPLLESQIKEMRELHKAKSEHPPLIK